MRAGASGFHASLPESARTLRTHLPFRVVNLRGQPDHQPDLQRHHLLPRGLLVQPCFGRMFDAIDGRHCHFHDFRQNGMLLPCREQAALRTGLPLHRGPHRRYSALVVARVGLIERAWSGAVRADPRAAALEVHMRLALLQNALRRFLLSDGRRRIVLNRRDPLRVDIDFQELDAMADALWGATETV